MLLISTKNSYFNNLGISKINDNRYFWKPIFPFFFFENKPKSEKCNLNKESENISGNAELWRIFYNYYSEVISNLKIPSLIDNSADDSNAVTNPLSIATKLFDQHPSIINAKKKKIDSVLNLKENNSTEVENVINNLSIVKACQKDNIPTKVVKINNDAFAGFIAKDFNNCVDKGVFPDDLKHGDVTPAHKKKDKNLKPITGLYVYFQTF